ncbi:hypothetical protein CALVIDRAFT_532606 [Calocera viscosa TUFC12733]|uniref:D-isomer specific 2-hydroxyacid dehydrogenase NAD-binding domain-containing protein n=1 Tax=Calocera viscosa (strain TUFC12733) TaxID=1330018 RepID=A0A167SF96_CALVF|nr:hypothetical protein CALVIDRAFT_532606 [Calocera viscosa TUFC12733]
MAARPEIRTVLSTLTWKPEEVDQIRRAFAPAEFVQCNKSDTAIIEATLQRAQAAILAGDLDDRVLKAPSLAWVHCDHAGLNHSARPEVFAKGLLVTGSAGRSGPALAQHGFWFALAFVYDVRNALDRQSKHIWGAVEEYRERRALWGLKLGVVGFGYTGKEMARLGRAFGMHVTVLRRTAGESSPDVDVMLSTDAGDGLDEIIQADIVMLATSLSDTTYHLFGANEFLRMKKDAIIINMARGSVIDETALIAALRTGEIAGAGLDTFEKEPLPADSPLWDMPNVLITPHATPQMPDKTQRSIDVIVKNIALYREGQPLLNAIQLRDLYTKH